jgi:hypothetical protein
MFRVCVAAVGFEMFGLCCFFFAILLLKGIYFL